MKKTMWVPLIALTGALVLSLGGCGEKEESAQTELSEDILTRSPEKKTGAAAVEESATKIKEKADATKEAAYSLKENHNSDVTHNDETEGQQEAEQTQEGTGGGTIGGSGDLVTSPSGESGSSTASSGSTSGSTVSSGSSSGTSGSSSSGTDGGSSSAAYGRRNSPVQTDGMTDEEAIAALAEAGQAQEAAQNQRDPILDRPAGQVFSQSSDLKATAEGYVGMELSDLETAIGSPIKFMEKSINTGSTKTAWAVYDGFVVNCERRMGSQKWKITGVN